MKVLILDSGPIINLAINGLLYVFENLKENFDGKFIITNEVKREIYDKPIKVQRFELEALRIKQLIDKKIFEFPESIGINTSELEKETRRLMDIANTSIESHHRKIKIMSEAEMSCIALSKILTKKKIENIIAVDERTARIISEKPENLQKIISNKIHEKAKLVNPHLEDFKHLKFIRSSEIVYVAHKKGLTNLKDKKALEAFLYATKFKGSSISWDEIRALKKL